MDRGCTRSARPRQVAVPANAPSGADTTLQGAPCLQPPDDLVGDVIGAHRHWYGYHDVNGVMPATNDEADDLEDLEGPQDRASPGRPAARGAQEQDQLADVTGEEEVVRGEHAPRDLEEAEIEGRDRGQGRG